jgi:DNA-binding MarR family transcriptional regulator
MWTPEDATREFLSILPLLNRILIAALRQEVGEETTMPQFRVLSYLNDQPLTLSAIARLRRVSLQSAGDLVQTLVDRGWITRVADPNDRRQMLLHLTDAGREKYVTANSGMLAQLTPYLAELTPEELAAVEIALPALHRVLAREDNPNADDSTH